MATAPNGTVATFSTPPAPYSAASALSPPLTSHRSSRSPTAPVHGRASPTLSRPSQPRVLATESHPLRCPLIIVVKSAELSRYDATLRFDGAGSALVSGNQVRAHALVFQVGAEQLDALLDKIGRCVGSSWPETRLLPGRRG